MKKLQITFDARDPVALARFWADVLEYEVEPPPDGFESWDSFLKDLGVPEDQLGSRSAARDPGGVGPRLYFQRVSSPATGGIHLDIEVSGGPGVLAKDRRQRIEVEAQRLTALGAKRRQVVDRDDDFWIVMEDPEGNPFCLQ